jgi:hypothetical protein
MAVASATWSCPPTVQLKMSLPGPPVSTSLLGPPLSVSPLGASVQRVVPGAADQHAWVVVSAQCVVPVTADRRLDVEADVVGLAGDAVVGDAVDRHVH